MASLVNRNGRYYAQWKDAERIPQRRRLSLATRNRRVAEQLLNELDAAFKLGTWDPWLQTIDELHDRPQEVRAVSDVLGRFLESKQLEGLSKETLTSYSSVLNRFARSVGRTTYLERITEQEVAQFSFKASLARSTQRLRHRIIRAFLNWSEREGYLKDNPIGRVQSPRPVERLPRVVRPADLETLCETIRTDYREKLLTNGATVRGACREGDLIWTIPLFWLALYTGMRISELARLKWKHIDTEKRLIYIHQQKNRKAQTIPLTTIAAAILEEVGPGEASAYVFHAPRASSMDERSTKAFVNRVSSLFTRYRRQARLPEGLTVHGLRHGFCTLLAEKGKSAAVIQAAARHAHLGTSMRYIHLANEHLKAELDDVFS